MSAGKGSIVYGTFFVWSWVLLVESIYLDGPTFGLWLSSWYRVLNSVYLLVLVLGKRVSIFNQITNLAAPFVLFSNVTWLVLATVTPLIKSLSDMADIAGGTSFNCADCPIVYVMALLLIDHTAPIVIMAIYCYFYWNDVRTTCLTLFDILLKISKYAFGVFVTLYI